MKLTRYFNKPEVTSTATRILLFAVIFLGIALRIAQFASDRSLWLDEAMLALNIANRSFIGLMQPLDYNQGAPIGFLLMQKLVILALGNYDWVLRLIPLGAGITAVIMVYKVASIYLQKTGTLVAVALFAISSRLIYYASEVKQYSSDVLISLLLLILANKCLQVKVRPKNYIALIVVSIAAMWISHPALFTLVGVGLALLFDLLLKKERRKLLWLGILLLAWIANIAILYLTSLRSLAANSALIDYWHQSFMPMPPWRDPAWFLNAFLEMFRNPVGLINRSTAIIGMIVSIVGLLSYFVYKRKYTIILLIPFLVVMLASGMQKYPFGDRLLLFIVPLVFLFIGEGIERIGLILLRVNPWASLGVCLIITGLVLYEPTKLAFQNLSQPNMGEHIKPVIAYMRQHKLDTDHVYIYYSAFPAFTYYAPMYGITKEDYYIGIASRQEPSKYLADLDRYIIGGRIWFVFSHNCFWCTVDEETYYVKYLDHIGVRLDEYRAPGASLYLYYIEPTKTLE